MLTVCTVFLSVSVGFVRVSAAQSPEPVVCVEGVGMAIYVDKNDPNSGNITQNPDILRTMIPEMLSQLAKPLLEAYLKGNFDEYCDKVMELYSPYFEPLALDEKGEASNGSGNDCNQRMPKHDAYNASAGGYQLKNYYFVYDWRLDPFETAKQLHTYIEKVKEVTGRDKVNVSCRCYGANVVLAYVAEYGSDSINKLIMYCSGVYGFDYCGALFSGRVAVDSNSLTRFVNVNFSSDDDETQKLIKSTIQLANSTFMLNWGVKEVLDFYKKVYENLTPRMMRVSYGSFPSYWSMVTVEYYDDAIELNFGAEREKYAEMIRKCDKYHNKVARRVDEILLGMRDNGVEIYFIAKYGFQLIPICKNSEYQSDGDVLLYSSSCGATNTELSKKFSKKYVEDAKKKGTDKYISPDLCIDASTGLFRDHTWFVKDVQHSVMPDAVDNTLFVKIFNSPSYLTVFDDPDYPQYFLYDKNDKTLKVLTTENCVTDEEKKWESNVGESSEFLLKKFFDLINKIIKYIRDFIESIISSVK